MPNDSNYIADIATVKEKVINLERSMDMHSQDDEKRFDRIFQYIKDGFNENRQLFDKTNERMETIWDERNQAKGVFKFSKMIGPSLAGAIGSILTFLFTGGHK